MQVTRRRRRNENDRSRLLGRQIARRIPLLTAGCTAVALVATGSAIGQTGQFGFDQVGQTTERGQVVSADQYIAPYGDRLVNNNGKIMSSSVSPDGTHLAATMADGGSALTIFNLTDFSIQQQVSAAATSSPQLRSNDVGQEGPTYSPDGKQLWIGQLDGYTKLDVNADGSVANPTFIAIPAEGSKRALAAEPVFSADGSTVYSAVNGQNKVVALDAATGTVKQTWAVGNAPRDMAMVGNKLYVSNEGGRPARPGDTTINSYGTQVPADPKTGAVTTGTVSVIDLANPSAEAASINVGLHPTSLYAKNGALFVTNTATNNVSVIDTADDKVVQTINAQPWPEASVGYEPNATTLTDDGHLLVTLGRANAVAVYRYKNPKQPASFVGLLPTDYFPNEVATVGDQIVVSNARGIDARRPRSGNGHQTHDTVSSLTRFTLPDDSVIRAQTSKVFQMNGWTSDSMKERKGDRAAAVPVPARLGDPSTIKHVFLLVKENRTYDQVFGDMPEGNGDPTFTQYGENVTPNQHAMARQFGLYDNTYDVGTNSAEGHNWLMQANDPEYTESSAGEYTRSYDTENDTLGHQRTGFIWSGAQAAGKSVRDFGEFQQLEEKPSGSSWQNLYCDTKDMRATGADTKYPIKVGSPIPSLNDVSVQGFPKFDTSVPDVYKAEIWKRDFEKNGPANLNMFWLSNDHTGGPANGPAQVADNDLATGRIVDEITHSTYWKDSAIFVVEDDSQAGTDHVDGHRAPIQIISPYAKHGVVDSHYYSQIMMIRTIEQILGIHPMNQLDTAATPMTAAFNTKPDLTPFTALPNRTALTDGLSTPPSCGLDTPAPQDPQALAVPSTKVPADKEALAAKWQEWKSHQRLTGEHAIPDFANPAQMNHFSWYESFGFTKPYPGESKLFAPDDVPGAFLPGSESDG